MTLTNFLKTQPKTDELSRNLLMTRYCMKTDTKVGTHEFAWMSFPEINLSHDPEN